MLGACTRRDTVIIEYAYDAVVEYGHTCKLIVATRQHK